MACAGELQQLISAVEAGRGGCLVIEGFPAPSPVVPDTVAQVLRHRASAEEQLLTHAALAALCRPLAPWMDHLPSGPAQALADLVEGRSVPSDGLAVASAFRSLLWAAAAAGPVVLVVEQGHLLDRGSAAALGFAARGAQGCPLGLVVVQEAGALGRLELPFAERCRGGPVDHSVFQDNHGAGGIEGEPQVPADAAGLVTGDLDAPLEAARVARRRATHPAAVAAAELRLGRAHLLAGSVSTAVAHLRAAIEAAPAGASEQAAEAALLLVLPSIVRVRADRVHAALEEAVARIEQAVLEPTHPLRALEAAARTALDVVGGRPVDEPALLSLAHQLARSARPTDVALVVNLVALPLVWLEHHRPASVLLRCLISELRTRDADGDLATALCALSAAERRAGRPARALLAAGEARQLAEAGGLQAVRSFALSELANAHAIMGDGERCRIVAQALLEAEPPARGVHRTSGLSALATAELWVGDPAAAVELLEPLAERSEASPPAVTLFQPTLVAAYAAVGRHDDAAVLLERLEASVRGPGRLLATVARCRALLAPAEERDAAFAAAIDAATGSVLTQGLTRVVHARRLLADGEGQRGEALLRELAELADEDLLGVARAARHTLDRLGQIRAGEDRAGAGASRPSRPPPPHREVRLLGGLAVVVDGDVRPLPAGAASTAVAVVALRRAVHVEELAEVLWPGTGADIARRRLRNVLARVRQAVGPILERRGDRVVVAEGVRVDHHELEVSARRALAAPPGAARARLLAELVCAHQGPLLPEAAYDEWAHAPRRRAEVRYEELVRALAEERAST
ncbi:MAG: hypothetical protein ACLGI8_01355 [Acidimicrobiia bacterium]